MIKKTDKTIQWLMTGDPAIRWQTMLGLLNAPPAVYQAERLRTSTEGWGARLLAFQTADGLWGGGIYSPKWISTTYTLLLLRHIGLPPEHPQALRGCEHFLIKDLEKDGGINLFKSLHYSELCINGMILALLSYFRYPDERVHDVAEFLLKVQMPDGGWNCEQIKGATHASFHTTLTVLEGLAEYGRTYPRSAASLKKAQKRAREFLLVHRLYRSHRTGEIVDPAMTRMSFPPRWRYDFLRALDYFQSVQAPKDDRMGDAIELLKNKKTDDDRWLLNMPWAGRKYFDMEKAGKPSHWNTLRALRVLKWWE
jgi:hypothetical protein